MSTTPNGEVTIICLTDAVHLHDIGVHLTRGHRATISMSQAARSRDLSAAKLDRTVSIIASKAAATVRAQEYTSSDTTHSQAPRHVSHAPTPVVDLSLLVDAVERMAEEVRGMRADITRLMQQPPADLSRVVAMIEERLSHPVMVVRVPGKVEVPSVPDDLPAMFIPSNLTGGVAAQELQVVSHTSESPQLSGTAELLKAARKKR